MHGVKNAAGFEKHLRSELGERSVERLKRAGEAMLGEAVDQLIEGKSNEFTDTLVRSWKDDSQSGT